MRWLSKLLQEHSTKQYFIEHSTYKSSHVAHGIIALERLGASEDRTREWVNWYRKRLEKPMEKNHTWEDIDARDVTEENLQSATGKRKHFYSFLNFYKSKLNDLNGDVDALIRRDFPKLSLGMQASLLHGVIQLGYGYAVKEECIILEGLAYLRHSYSPMIFDSSLEQNDLRHFGKGEVAITDVIQALKSDDELFDNMVSGMEVYRSGEWIASDMQYKIRSLADNGDKLIRYANMVKVPDVVTRDPASLADWILEQALIVYVMAQPDRRNDFIILHGVTSAWSVRQLVPILDPRDAIEALRTLLCLIFAVYIGVGGPALTQLVDTSLNTDGVAWSELLETTLAPNIQRDAHAYKIIHICNELRNGSDHSSSALYYTAAKIALENPFPPIEPSQPRL